MKACGIIVEYNPFHNGHAYHIEKARERSQAEVIVAVMSGNFLQRGEPAVMDKWIRTAEALKNGADLVVELPFFWAVQSADYFARGGVKLLQALNCEFLCFGTDSPHAVDYQSFGEFTAANQTLIEQKYREISQKHLSHSRQMTQVFRELYPALHLDFSSPNHILGLSYSKENARYDHPMKLLPVKRKGSEHNEEKLHLEFASATAVRTAALKGNWTDLKGVLPNETFTDLTQNVLVSWENYWPLLRYRLISSSHEELRSIYQMTEGIEYRLKEKVLKADNFHQFIESVKTKRYTWTRLQRLAVYILANISAEEICQGWKNSYLNILGMTENGQNYLKMQKKRSSLPILTKQKKETEEYFKTGIKCDQVYQLGNRDIAEQNSGRFPVQIKKA